MPLSVLYTFKSLIKYVGIAVVVVFLLVPRVDGVEVGNTSTPPSPESDSPKSDPQKSEHNIVDFLAYVTDLSKGFVELENQLDEMITLSRFENDISEISNDFQLLSQQVSMALTNVKIEYHHLEIIKTKAYKLGYRANKVNDSLFKTIEILSNLNTEWAQKKEMLDSWAEIAQNEMSFDLVKADILIHQKKSERALELISKKLKPALAAQKKSFEFEIKIYALTHGIEKHTQAFQKEGEKKSISIFSSDFYSQMDKEFFETILKNIVLAVGLQKHLIAEQYKPIFVLCLVISILSILVRRSQKWTKASDDLYPFTQRPVASSIFLFLAGLAIANFFSEGIEQLPQNVEPVKRIILLVSILRISGAMLETVWKKRLFWQILVLAIMIEFFQMINLPPNIFYLFNFFATALILIYCLRQNWLLSRQKISFFKLLGLRFVALMLLGIFVLEFIGYQEFAGYLFIKLLYLSIYVLVFWILVTGTRSILEIFLLTTPLPVAQRNSSVIVTQLMPVIMFFYIFVLSIIALQFLGIYPTKEAAIQSLQSFNLAAGSWAISPGNILKALITFYCVLLFSKAIQGLLLQVVLPRQNAAKGVQFSIVRLVNYAVLALGFLLVFDVLGFELGSLKIFGGALGIGIGFGLQAIVTNVASGLILLFERPIKVGDMIQVNDESGEIKKLGLRATIVQTLDHAEIVIPNSDLVTGQVTNWTLAERRIRVKVPIGVAYGTDTTNVLKILMNCADECPMVLSDPSPRALFLSFGESSLDFELRVWIPDFNDRRVVLSELNQDINNELMLAGIEIPFPQRDLHFRSASEVP